YSGESRFPREYPGGITQVLPEFFDDAHAAGVAAMFFDLLDAAEAPQSQAAGFLRRHASGDVAFNLFVKMVAKLFVEILLDSGSPNQRPQAHMKPIQHCQTSLT